MGKTKLFVGLILLIVGAGLIPTGIILDDKINEGLDAAIPGALLQIRDEFLPAAADLIKREAVPEVLLGIKDDVELALGATINGTVSANTLNYTIFELGKLVTDTVAIDMFFNDLTWTGDTGISAPISFSQHAGVSLGYSVLAQNAILFGNNTFPGLISDITSGTNITAFLLMYESALGEIDERIAMSFAYDATWGQLVEVADYLVSYLFPLVPTFGGYPLPAQYIYPEAYFFAQWANASIVPTGITLPLAGGIEAWELAADVVSETVVITPSGFSVELCTELWDATNSTSPFNTTDDQNDGFHYWYSAYTNPTQATELKGIYGMDTVQFDLFTDYLFDGERQDRVTVPIIEYSEGDSYEDVVLNYFYFQWSVGRIIPSGIGSLGSEYEILDGFEVILPADNTIPPIFALGLTRCGNLWDPNNNVALTNPDGIVDWLSLMRIEADYQNTRKQNILSSIEYPIVDNEFSLSAADVVTMADWLYRFRYNILPKLAIREDINGDSQYSIHPSELANMLSITGIAAGGLLGFLGMILILNYRRR